MVTWWPLTEDRRLEEFPRRPERRKGPVDTGHTACHAAGAVGGGGGMAQKTLLGPSFPTFCKSPLKTSIEIRIDAYSNAMAVDSSL